MTEDGGARVSSDDPTVSNSASQTRQRKKRKWDQPAEAFVSAGFAVPFTNMGNLAGMPLPGVAPVPGTFLPNTLAASGTAVTPFFQQHAAPVVPKQNQTKIQDELVIAREIVINDAESSVRYKLTKRQTQEEIQRCTGAVVITRGKYHPPNAPPDGEKPLYLHISSAAHLKETAERILAVDRAAAMVEELLKHGQSSQAGTSPFKEAVMNGVKAFSTCVYLGFDTDPSLNVAARIRGPNDQYINHIMNETGATVTLRGCGSGNSVSLQGEEAQQPLHLFLSSNNPKSLDDAKRLAENLMDTISLEFGASRVSSSKVYGAVPPPQQLLTGVQSSATEQNLNASSAGGLTSMPVAAPAPAPLLPPPPPVSIPGVTTSYSQGMAVGMPNSGPIQANSVGYPQPLVTTGTSYIGYGGIYPQATPLQQVALVLRQSSPIPSTVVPATSVASAAVPPMSAVSTVTKSSVSSALHSEKEQRPPQKRKFQELPAGSKGSSRLNQVSESSNSNKPLGDLGVRNVSTMPAPKKLINPSANGMPPPPPKTLLPPPAPPKAMMPPPPPPKFTSSKPPGKSHDKNKDNSKAKLDDVPDTLMQLMSYGDEDDDSEESSDESQNNNSNANGLRKPFWAL